MPKSEKVREAIKLTNIVALKRDYMWKGETLKRGRRGIVTFIWNNSPYATGIHYQVLFADGAHARFRASALVRVAPALA
jgi:hypothetical protein